MKTNENVEYKFHREKCNFRNVLMLIKSLFLTKLYIYAPNYFLPQKDFNDFNNFGRPNDII